ncbi:MAG TPA: hypothetical protein VH436_00815 [Vicinamibacterales bacterium]|jgi:hypothetical protein
MPLDPRIPSAITSDASALGLMNQLHQQIISSPDANTLGSLLGTYTAVAAIRAARRSSPPPLPSAVTSTMPTTWGATPIQPQRESRIYVMVSNILKAVHEQANNTITNVKA